MKLRFARHTNDLDKIKSFYINVLGFQLLGEFTNHDNYDGIFIGKPNLDWHLEFTKSNETAKFEFGDEDYLVLYPYNMIEYDSIIDKIHKNKVALLDSKNPYWNKYGTIILDPDGFRIIISNLKT